MIPPSYLNFFDFGFMVEASKTPTVMTRTISACHVITVSAAFKYLDDSAMGVDLAVKQVVHFLHGRRRVLRWLGNTPKQRGKIGKFFFRVGVTNKWTRIVLSYRVRI